MEKTTTVNTSRQTGYPAVMLNGVKFAVQREQKQSLLWICRAKANWKRRSRFNDLPLRSTEHEILRCAQDDGNGMVGAQPHKKRTPKPYPAFIALMLSILLAACVHEYPEGAGRREIRLEWQSARPDELAGIRLWVFGSDGVLTDELTFATAEEAQGARITAGAEPCTLVAATCPVSHYSFTAKRGETTRDGLLVTLNDPLSDPPHVQSGAAAVPPEARTATLAMTRVLSELQLTLRDLPPEVVKVRATVLNCARGFRPGAGRLEDAPVTAVLGEVVPTDGQAAFPVRRLMPVVPLMEDDAAGEAASAGTASAKVAAGQAAAYDTRMTLEMTYAGGGTAMFRVAAPPMKNNGSYTPVVAYGRLREDVVLTLTEIDGWGASDEVEGDIKL